MPDILPFSFWHGGFVEGYIFAKADLYPMNDFLESEVGRELYEAFTEIEWKQAEHDGKIYTIPKRNGGLFYSGERYLYVNDLYREEFEKTYDGTYQSLQKLLDMHPDLSYGTQGVVSEVVEYWLGYCSLFNLSYQVESGKVVDITKLSETKELLQSIYSDVLAGRFRLIKDDPESFTTDLLAFEMLTKRGDVEGFTRYPLLKNYYTGNFGIYGIAASSTQKELVVQILGACYSDPEVASVIEWREADAEEWLSITEARKNAEPTALTGFILELTAEEIDALYRYGQEDKFYLCSNMFTTDSRGNRSLNPDYLKYLDKFFDKPKDYGDLFDTVNKQLEGRCVNGDGSF